MRDIFIEPTKEGKGRNFAASLFGMVQADSFWKGGQTDTKAIRPVYAVIAGSNQEIRPFVANLQMGKKVKLLKEVRWQKTDTLEFLKTSKYQYYWQKSEIGSVVTILLPELFQLDPGMVDPEGFQFILLPTKKKLSNFNLPLPGVLSHVEKLKYPLSPEEVAKYLPLAVLFCSYLDRRTRIPLIMDLRFFFQVFYQAVKVGMASFPRKEHYSTYRPEWGQSLNFLQEGLEELGIPTSLACKGTHEELELFMADEVVTYYKAVA